VRELLASRATLLLALAIGPLVGHAFTVAVRTYADVSGSAGGAAALAQGISPLDGILVPTFGAYALVATLLLPFVAIRVISAEKESGALALLRQGPTSLSWMVLVKAKVLLLAWIVAWVPGMMAVGLWRAYGGHVDGAELVVVLAGHLLRGVVVIAVAFAAAAITDGAASAAVVTLGVTLGTWALDFVAQVQGGVAQSLARFTPDATLRTFEQGEWSLNITLVTLVVSVMLVSAATVWMQSGWSVTRRAIRSGGILAIGALLIVIGATRRASVDASEDRRNSFSRADEAALRQLAGPIRVTANLAPEDPRWTDLQRSVLHKLERLIPVEVTTTARTSTGLFEKPAQGYGEVWYEWDGQRRMSRSTTVPIVLETLYDLTGVPAPTNREPDPYPGYPLIATPRYAALLFYGVCPSLILLFALWRRRSSSRPRS
jgi:hypothetical protein